MKKIYTLIAAVAITFSATAQNRSSVSLISKIHPLNTPIKPITSNGVRANGDTLMWFPLPGVLLSDPADQAAFSFVKEDIDGLPTNNSTAPMDFGLYYSLDAGTSSKNFYHPWENPSVDTAFFLHATSWFNPAGQANNWVMMGPITLPAGGILSWYDKTNPGYRDGYKVYISAAVSSPMTYSDFSTQVFTRVDATPGNTQALDTAWALRTVTIPAQFNSQSIYVAFNHNANDQDVLNLDEFLIVEAPLGIEENAFVNGVKINQNSPNPCSNSTVINYEIEKNSTVALSIYDVTGKKVAEQNEGNQNAGKHTIRFDVSNLSEGVYYYSLNVGKKTASSMKMVVIK